MYTLDFRHDLNLLDTAWTGLFTEQVALAYVQEVNHRFVQEGFRSGYRLRMDLTRMPVQPKDAMLAMNTKFKGFPRASRIAIVTTGSISRLQVRRLMKQPYLSIFDDSNVALAWLLDDRAAAA